MPGGFILGPLALGWWRRACRLPGKALAVALAVWFEAGRRGRPDDLKLTARIVSRFGVGPDAKSRALAALERAGLVAVVRVVRKNPRVTILRPSDLPALPDPRPGGGVPWPWRVKGEFIRGPLPLAWWERACQLPGGKVLAVALALWFEAGLQKRATDLRLPKEVAERFGVSRGAKSEGLRALEGAGLIRVVRVGSPSVRVTLVPVEAGAARPRAA
jgi:DNA-binding transcriptional ArsR family regulator